MCSEPPRLRFSSTSFGKITRNSQHGALGSPQLLKYRFHVIYSAKCGSLNLCAATLLPLIQLTVMSWRRRLTSILRCALSSICSAAPGNGRQSYEVRLDAETATQAHFLWPVLRIAFVGAVAAAVGRGSRALRAHMR
jgi:hypothetical protein